MNHLIVSIAFIIAFTQTIRCEKCEVMKDAIMKAEFNKIKSWAEGRCKENPALKPEDLNKAKGCYEKHIHPIMSTPEEQSVHTFLQKKVFIDSTLQVCKDKGVQKSIQQSAMKDIGMPKAIKLKNHCEKDCKPYQDAFKAYNGCVMA